MYLTAIARSIVSFCCFHIGDHPLKTSAFLRRGGVKNWPNLPTDISKKLPTEGVKNREKLPTS